MIKIDNLLIVDGNELEIRDNLKSLNQKTIHF